ncbi:hypothetical protein GOC46_32385, partial [Sinorhizobium meliloti]|nr:hypothetical protein [Sinorhizobium meliloti]MDX0384738.1 hypothetical protein [Sinorhizobium meliloti]
RGRLFLGIGGRDHFGIRGRIASEFASRFNAQPNGCWFTGRPRHSYTSVGDA